MALGSLDFRDRTSVFAALEARTFDVIVIGGGVTGAGVARDAAMRGLAVALVEARDLASGTSSRSSKMIHGGLRYMAQGDIGLVQEAASERKAVERIAPHLTRQTPFVIPARNAAAIAKLRAGMWAFEKLGAVPKARKHEVWSKAGVAAREPSLNASDLFGAVAYPEYLTDDSRLTLANARSAAAHGAIIATYAPVQSIIVENGKAVGVTLADALGGAQGAIRVRGKVIINAAGPWVDAIRALEQQSSPARLKLTKGIHVVVPRSKLPVTRTIILPASDRRSVFAVPKGEMTYLGTTDTFYPDADYWPRVETLDIDYLFAAAARCFATPPLSHRDIVTIWSGVRPLVAEEGKSASEISRRDEIWTGPHGVLSIAGGKLTAYRKMAARVVDLAQSALGQSSSAAPTDKEPLIGGDVDVARTVQALGAAGERLVGLYGSEAPSIVQAGGGPAAEAHHAVLHEGALTLEDYWVRRSARAWFDPDGGMAALAPAAAAMAQLLGWSPAESEKQIDACRALRAQSLKAVEHAL